MNAALQIGIRGGGPSISLSIALSIFVLVALAYWTFNNAQTNSSQPPFLWGMVVVFAPLFGFVLYLVVGRNR